MRVVTAAQMRVADQRTIVAGTSQETLMERAAKGVVDTLEGEYGSVAGRRAVVICGPGNNGGDGLLAAQILRDRAAIVQVVRVKDAPVALDPEADFVIDALLGTGFRGEVTGRFADLIHAMNHHFPHAKVIAVDIPSAMQVRADCTVTFAAPKAEMLLHPSAHLSGKIIVHDIGIPDPFLPSGLFLSEPQEFVHLFQPRRRDAHKGDFGHVLVVGGAPGKTGAAAMAGLSALRMGAGWVTVACSDPSRLAVELLSEPLESFTLARKTVVAVGPGLGMDQAMVQRLMEIAQVPMVLDADALNSIAGTAFHGRGVTTILTPHPGEMARLMGVSSPAEVGDRVTAAREFTRQRNVCLVLKGFRTLVAIPDGNVFINPTGSPALAKAGSGDILTGLIAGMVAQFPDHLMDAVRAAVWLHGRLGELAAERWTEFGVLATDLLGELPLAIREIRAGRSA